ncbi:MAG: hypothetical protein ACOC0N_02295, partial [Chroococcales cyanobacterium]
RASGFLGIPRVTRREDVKLPNFQLIPGAISAILASASETGALTLADRYGLMAASMDESLNEEESRAVSRLLRAVVKGRIRVINELSAAA